MTTPMVIVETYDDIDIVNHDKGLLEEAGLHPVIVPSRSGEPFDRAGGESDGLYALQVPQAETGRAMQILEEFWEAEVDEAIDMYEN